MAKNGIPTSPIPATQHIYIQAGNPSCSRTGGIFGRSVKSIPAPIQYVIPITAQNTVIHVPKGWSVQVIQNPVMYYPPMAAPQAALPTHYGQYQPAYSPQKPQQSSGEILQNEYNRLWQQDASIRQDHTLETLATYLRPSLQKKGFPANTVSDAKAVIQDLAHDMALKTVRHVEYFINDVESYEQYNSFLSAHTPKASKDSAPISEPVETETKTETKTENIVPKEPEVVVSHVQETEIETDIIDEPLAEVDEIAYPHTAIEVHETNVPPAISVTGKISTPSQEQPSHSALHNTGANDSPLPQTARDVATAKISEDNLPKPNAATALPSSDKEAPVGQPTTKISNPSPRLSTKPIPPPKPEGLAQKAAKTTTTVKPASNQTITAGQQPATPSHAAEPKSAGTTEKDVQTTRTTVQPQKAATQSPTQRDQTTTSASKSTQETQTSPVRQREQSTETRPLPETNTQGTQTQSISRSQGSQTTKPNQTSFSTQTQHDGIARTADTNTPRQSPAVETNTEKTNSQAASAGTQTSSPKTLDNSGSAPVTNVVTASASSARYENIDALQPNNGTGSSLKTESSASIQQPNVTEPQSKTRPQIPHKSLAVRLKAALINFFRLGLKSDATLASSETRSVTGASSIASSDASDIADLASLEGEHNDYTVDDAENQPEPVDTIDTSDIDSEYDDDGEWDDDEWDNNLDLASHTYENINTLSGSENDGNVETSPPSNPYENINRLHRYENIDVLTQPDVDSISMPTESPQASSSPAYENLRVLNEPDTTRVQLDTKANDATSDYISEDGTADNASQTSSIEQHDIPAPPQETSPIYATIDKSRKQPDSIASSDSGFGEASPRDLMDDDISLTADSPESGDGLVDIATKERMLEGWEELSVSWNDYKNLYQALSKGANLKNPNDRLTNAQNFAKLAAQAKPLNDKLQSALVALHNDIKMPIPSWRNTEKLKPYGTGRRTTHQKSDNHFIPLYTVAQSPISRWPSRPYNWQTMPITLSR